VAVVHALLFYPVFLSAFAWSESLYILLSVSSLALVSRGFTRMERAGWEFAAAGALAGLAMLTRYIGFTLIAAGLLSIVLVQAHHGRRLLGKSLLWFGIPAALPNVLWLARNHRLTGFYFGEDRPPAFFQWDQIIQSTTRALLIDWTAPILHLEALWASLVGVAGVAGLLCVFLAILPRLGTVRLFPEEERPTGVRLLLAVTIATYVLAIIVLSQRIGFDAVNSRYLSPVYPLILVLVVGNLRSILVSDRRRGARRRRWLLATGVLLWLVPQVASTGYLVARAGVEERELTQPYWTSTLWDDAAWDADPGLRRLEREGPKAGLVISNLWDFVGIRTGMNTKPLPEASHPSFPGRLADFPGALVAVHRERRQHMAGAEDLRRAVQAGVLEDLGDTGPWSFFRVPGGAR
jgi:4-amino-4-deoxy-L-arabinose transferase-like glycosyltransferase